MPYLGNELATQFQAFVTQTITGDGSTSYTLDRAVANGKELLVYINNVKQEEGSGKSYTATGTTIAFSAAVASTDSCYVVFLGSAVQTVNPPDASIGSSQITNATLVMPNKLDMNGNELILDADADTSITADTDDQVDIKIGGSDKVTVTTTGLTVAGGSSNNDDTANAITASGSQHTRMIVDTSSTSGHRASYVLESNSNEVSINTTGSDEMNFITNATDRMKIAQDGTVTIVNQAGPLTLGRNESSGSVTCIGFNNNATSITSISGQCFRIMGDGDVENSNNSYGSISDLKLKENIVDASSQWNDIKALKVKNFSFKKDKLDKPNMIGVIAQDVEAAGMSGLITERYDNDGGKDLETTSKAVKYSVLYMKAVKALQEAMTRIETLEAKITVLESK